MILGAIFIGALVGYFAAFLLFLCGSSLVTCALAVPVIGGVTVMAVAIRSYGSRRHAEEVEAEPKADAQTAAASEKRKPEYA